MADLILDTSVPKKTRPTSVKVSPAYVSKRNTENKLPTVPESCSDKKADSSTEQLLLTLMEEVKVLKKKIEIPSYTSPLNSQSSSSKSTKKKTWFGPCKQCRYSKESGPKVVFGDDSLRDTEGYGSANCNGITFTRVAYVNGLKHNLISISQLCDANFKVLFIKT
nr:retrovirus-related Pol polyprotein from transposon TNT 1-94 [Tanacetum cinerariifolium]